MQKTPKKNLCLPFRRPSVFILHFRHVKNPDTPHPRRACECGVGGGGVINGIYAHHQINFFISLCSNSWSAGHYAFLFAFLLPHHASANEKSRDSLRTCGRTQTHGCVVWRPVLLLDQTLGGPSVCLWSMLHLYLGWVVRQRSKAGLRCTPWPHRL